jgi:hypothetical protein
MEGKKKQIYVVLIVACLIIIIALAFLLNSEESNDMINEEFPGNGNGGSNATVIASGSFQDGAHPTEGEALLIQMDSEMKLRLENFKTDSGPGLYVYLSIDRNDNDYVDLGELRATEGNMNYDVPSGTNTTKYNHVLIWCEPFSVLFGYAELT